MSTVQEEQKVVAFKLNNEYYGLDVHQINEVFTPSSITSIPQSSEHTAGVINYRGEIVTVIDLKTRLSIKKEKIKSDYDTLLDEEEGERIYVIIVKSGSSVVGLLVDYVEAVISIPQEKIQSTLDLISGKEQAAYLQGVARTDFGLTILLSLEAILSEYDILDASQLQQLRDKIMAESGADDEIVVDSGSIVNLDKDDIDDYTSQRTSFKKVEDTGAGFGDSPLDLEKLTKSELLKIAIEMNISDVSTRSTKSEIIKKIDKQLGN